MKKTSLSKNYLTLHAGTRSVSAMVFSGEGGSLGKSFVDIPSHTPESGWLQVDAEELWKASLQVCHDAVGKAGIYGEQIAALSIASERGTALIWDRVSSQALTPVISSQCRRTQSITESWKRKKLDRLVLQRTGLPVSDVYSAPKLLWLLEKSPELVARAKKREVLFGGIESWLLWKWTLGKVHATDYTNAAATMLLDVRSFRWDKRLMAKWKIPPTILPDIRPSSGIFGKTELHGSLPEGILIGAVAADQPAALFALTGLERGLAKASYDLHCHVMMNIGNRPKFSRIGMATTVACSAAKRASYILEGSVPNAGWPVHWMRDSLHLIDSLQETSDIALSASGPRDLFLVAQHSNGKTGSSPGGLVGLRSDIKKEDLVRAALESVAFETRNAMNTLSKDAKTGIRSVFVDGPMSQNDFLLQYQANLSNVDIARTKLGETACLGVSYLAGLAIKAIKSPASILRLRPIDQHFRPKLSSSERKKVLAGWDQAVQKIRKM